MLVVIAIDLHKNEDMVCDCSNEHCPGIMKEYGYLIRSP